MNDLIERLRMDLNDVSKDKEPFIINWTEAIIRRVWEKCKLGENEVDYELALLGLGALSRLIKSGKVECKYTSTELNDLMSRI